MATERKKHFGVDLRLAEGTGGLDLVSDVAAT